MFLRGRAFAPPSHRTHNNTTPSRTRTNTKTIFKQLNQWFNERVCFLCVRSVRACACVNHHRDVHKLKLITRTGCALLWRSSSSSGSHTNIHRSPYVHIRFDFSRAIFRLDACVCCAQNTVRTSTINHYSSSGSASARVFLVVRCLRVNAVRCFVSEWESAGSPLLFTPGFSTRSGKRLWNNIRNGQKKTNATRFRHQQCVCVCVLKSKPDGTRTKMHHHNAQQRE